MKNLVRQVIASVIACGLLAGPGVAHAQDRAQFRNQAKTIAAQIRAAGEPKDRCSIGAQIGSNGIVLRTYDASELSPGDRFLTINDVDAHGKTPEEIIGILRGIPASATVPVIVDRSGRPTNLTVQCVNARPYNEKILSALDSASNGKFDDCVNALSQGGQSGSYDAAMKLECAATSKNARRYNIAQLSFDALQSTIADAYWIPGTRKDVVARLHQNEGLITGALGKSKFDELVAATRQWPGDGRMYDTTGPNIAQFKRSAESALRARLIDPESARIEWPHGFIYGTWKPLFAKRIEGYWTCGLINARNRMGGYTGSTSFVVVLDQSGAIKYVEMGEAGDFDILTSQCNSSAKLLPPPPMELTAGANGSSQVPTNSIADELKKLVDLKNGGALTEEEFEAAKQKLLGTSSDP
jgi:hypothetical protein